MFPKSQNVVRSILGTTRTDVWSRNETEEDRQKFMTSLYMKKRADEVRRREMGVPYVPKTKEPTIDPSIFNLLRRQVEYGKVSKEQVINAAIADSRRKGVLQHSGLTREDAQKLINALQLDIEQRDIADVQRDFGKEKKGWWSGFKLVENKKRG